MKLETLELANLIYEELYELKTKLETIKKMQMNLEDVKISTNGVLSLELNTFQIPEVKHLFSGVEIAIQHKIKLLEDRMEKL